LCWDSFGVIICFYSKKEPTVNFDIEYINLVEPTHVFEGCEQLAQQEFTDMYALGEGVDIGGLVVYNEGTHVFDYENLLAWVK
jgi:hypothetical protein